MNALSSVSAWDPNSLRRPTICPKGMPWLTMAIPTVTSTGLYQDFSPVLDRFFPTWQLVAEILTAPQQSAMDSQISEWFVHAHVALAGIQDVEGRQRVERSSVTVKWNRAIVSLGISILDMIAREGNAQRAIHTYHAFERFLFKMRQADLTDTWIWTPNPNTISNWGDFIRLKRVSDGPSFNRTT